MVMELLVRIYEIACWNQWNASTKHLCPPLSWFSKMPPRAIHLVFCWIKMCWQSWSKMPHKMPLPLVMLLLESAVENAVHYINLHVYFYTYLVEWKPCLFLHWFGWMEMHRWSWSKTPRKMLLVTPLLENTVENAVHYIDLYIYCYVHESQLSSRLSSHLSSCLSSGLSSERPRGASRVRTTKQLQLT